MPSSDPSLTDLQAKVQQCQRAMQDKEDHLHFVLTAHHKRMLLLRAAANCHANTRGREGALARRVLAILNDKEPSVETERNNHWTRKEKRDGS